MARIVFILINSIAPAQHAPRLGPVAIRDKLKETLDTRGFWYIALDEALSFLTTFHTLFADTGGIVCLLGFAYHQKFIEDECTN